jgi:hypothetical protein
VDRRAAYRVRLWNLKEEDLVEDTGLDGRVILKWAFREMVSEDVGWISVAQHSDMWRAVVNSVISLWIS